MRLTEAEILAALDDDLSQRRPPAGSTDLSMPGAVEAYLLRRRNMTAEERLAEALED